MVQGDILILSLEVKSNYLNLMVLIHLNSLIPMINAHMDWHLINFLINWIFWHLSFIKSFINHLVKNKLDNLLLKDILQTHNFYCACKLLDFFCIHQKWFIKIYYHKDNISLIKIFYNYSFIFTNLLKILKQIKSWINNLMKIMIHH